MYNEGQIINILGDKYEILSSILLPSKTVMLWMRKIDGEFCLFMPVSYIRKIENWKKDIDFLNALYASGVDNWSGFAEAQMLLGVD